VKELEWLGPFGSEHQRPRFAASRVELAQPPRRMGGGDRHLALRVRQGNTVLRAVAFGNGDWADDLARRSGPISICFTANLNRYQGYDRVELQLIDWQAEPTAPAAMRAASQEVCLESAPAAGLDSSSMLPTETAVRT
jgi:single-stranded-DNA-specific exonuclease